MKTKPKKILAWHWAKADLKTQHSNEPIAKGKTLKATGPLQLCENGMHASLNPMDALQYAPGPMLCRVELSGEIIQGEDKLCASSRKVLWIANADHMLQEFACLCAERALKAAKVDDPRSWRAIEVKRLWLAGKATDAELAAARGAAWAAARDAARDAAWAAAWDAARGAAWDAARDAARGAAWDAARDAAWAAAWAAARDAARDAAWAAARGAARGAAWDAAWGAEIKWQRATLAKLIKRLPEYRRDAK